VICVCNWFVFNMQSTAYLRCLLLTNIESEHKSGHRVGGGIVSVLARWRIEVGMERSGMSRRYGRSKRERAYLNLVNP
jgi:hypothetical protein